MITVDIGSNHLGEFDLALKLFEKAEENGADAVKLQLFPAAIAGNNLVTPISWIKKLYQKAKSLCIRAYSSHWDMEGLIKSIDIQMDIWPEERPIVKLAYSQKDNKDLWKYAINMQCQIIVSVGSNCVNMPKYKYAEALWVNDCSGEVYYPGITEGEDLCPPIQYLNTFGYSGISHHGAIKTPRLAEAVSRGFDLEVHFMLERDHGKQVPDMKFSWTPRNLADFIKYTKAVK